MPIAALRRATFRALGRFPRGSGVALGVEADCDEVVGVPSDMAKTTRVASRRRVLLARYGGRRNEWIADEVAAHLMGCRTQMVRGLARKSPWAGLDDETLDSCFGHAAAVIAKVAVTGQRSDWRTPRDLEKAQIAAYRHQVLDHWKRVNAQSRQGDRFAVAFDPERHASGHSPMDRLFDQSDFQTIERDLLAELADDRLRAFWTIVLREQVAFKTAGDRLKLSKSVVMACTRGGRTAFASYLDRRESGELCHDRSLDIAAKLAGTATSWRVERAEAHLEGCYACALIHEPSTSAMQRGILGLAPTGLILRVIARASDSAAPPILRVGDIGSGSRVVVAGLAALTVAGAGVSAHRNLSGAPTVSTQPIAPPHVSPGPMPVIRRTALAATAANASLEEPRAAEAKEPLASPRKHSGKTSRQSLTTGIPTLPTPTVPQPDEFDIESAPRRASPAPAAYQPLTSEFANP